MSNRCTRSLKFVCLLIVVLCLSNSGAGASGSTALPAADWAPDDPLPDSLTVAGRLIDLNGNPLPEMVIRAVPASYNKLFLPAILTAASSGARSAGPSQAPAAIQPSPVSAWLPGGALNPDDAALPGHPGVITFTTDSLGNFTSTLPGRAYNLLVEDVDQKIPISGTLFINPDLFQIDQRQVDWGNLTFVKLPDDPLNGKVWVPGGSFWMGCSPLDGNCSGDENPQHLVELSDFDIDRNEVSNLRYAACVAAGDCTPPSSTSSFTRGSYYDNPQYAGYPVIYVTYDQASQYCAWEGGDLPSEAEWELAARGPSAAAQARVYPWGNQAPDCTRANYFQGFWDGHAHYCAGDTAAVDSRQPGASRYRLNNMAGNVQEWVKDWYQADYYSASPALNPPGPASGTERVLRGGNFNLYDTNLRLSDRASTGPGAAMNAAGFRCVNRIRFSISGRVTNGTSGVAGATVSDGLGHSVLTRSDGSYTMSGLHPGFLLTLTADKSGATFAPALRKIVLNSDAQVDFQQVHQISGSVRRGGMGVQGVVINLSGGYSGLTQGMVGAYTISSVPGGTYTVSPAHPSYFFEPVQQTLVITTSRTGIDFNALASFTLNGYALLNDADATRLQGVAIADANGHSTTTNADGYYALRLPEGARTITPTRPEATFTPASASLTVAGDMQQDFSGALTDMVYVPSGSFQMGDASGASPNAPLHTVSLSAYYIDKYEVTNARYAACVTAGRCTLPYSINTNNRFPYYGNPTYANFPVIWISHTQADAFCEWAGKRLPTEAEWEKVARGAADTRIYPWGNGALQACVNTNANMCMGDTSEVGSYPLDASPYSVLDLAGNVSEWVKDWFDDEYYYAAPPFNPPGPTQASDNFLVFRGGNFFYAPIHSRTFMREWSSDGSNNLIGARCVYSGSGDYVANGWRLRALPPPAAMDVPSAGASLVFNSSNQAQIAYLDGSWQPRLASYSGTPAYSPWQISPVYGASGANAVKLFLDASDHANLYYHTSHGWDLARWTGSDWSLESTPFLNGIWLQDSTDKMHIVYCDGNKLDYGYWNVTSWLTTTLETGMSGCTADPLVDSGYAMTAALDANNRPHIVYEYNNSLKKFRYRYQDTGGGWHSEDVTRTDSGASWFAYLSLKVDGAGKPHLSYYNGAYLYYATRPSSAWQFTAVDNEQMAIGWEPSLSLDATGKPRISYYAFGNNSILDQLRYATFNGSAWQKQILYVEANNAPPRNGGRNSVLALDSSDRAGIVFLVWDPDLWTKHLFFLFQPPP